MRLTIIQTGEVPVALRPRFGAYAPMFCRMFDRAGEVFGYDTVPVCDGAAFPDPGKLQGIIITGSAAGVYDTFPWLDPLRVFIRAAYEARTPMLGVCFGHQIMADALGGEVRKSEKGWGLGRHVYGVRRGRGFLAEAPEAVAIAASHQDQVIVAPAEADVFLASDFTPNAGLLYRNDAAISLQPHPEIDDAYTIALAEMRRGKAPDPVIEAALASISMASHSADVARALAAFFRARAPTRAELRRA